MTKKSRKCVTIAQRANALETFVAVEITFPKSGARPLSDQQLASSIDELSMQQLTDVDSPIVLVKGDSNYAWMSGYRKQSLSACLDPRDSQASRLRRPRGGGVSDKLLAPISPRDDGGKFQLRDALRPECIRAARRIAAVACVGLILRPRCDSFSR